MYLAHTRRYRWSVILIIVLVTVGDLFSILVPLWYKKFFDLLVADSLYADMFHILVVIFGIEFVHYLCIRIASFVTNYVRPAVIRDLSDSAFAYLHKHSFQFFQNHFVGSLVTKANRFSRSYGDVFDKIVWQCFPIVLNVGVINVVLWFQKPILGLIVSVWVFFFLILNYYLSRYKLPHDIKRSECESLSTGYLADTITNQSNVALFNGRQREYVGYTTITAQLRRLRSFSSNLTSIFDSVQWLLMMVLEFGLMYALLRLWKDGQATIGDFVLVQAYLIRMFEKLWDFGRLIRDLYESIADAEEMTVILDTPHETIDARNAKTLHARAGKIVFDNVSFAYHQTRKVVEAFDMTIRGSERVALVGPSGAGKSTIVKLLLRQYDLTKGKIFIDDQRIDKVTMESLWESMSLVPQDPILFHRTLMENIKYGKSDATDKEAINAARAAHAHEFIKDLPYGYNTYVGERGIKLSGGERQRVAIARAILRNAPILILDEATSSLDSESEMFIQDALDTLMKKKTVIVIAHRLSTIMKMDRILVIDDGKIVEEGTHKTLLRKKSGIYKKLWDIQAGGFIE